MKFKRDPLSFEFKQMMKPCLEKIFENKSKTGTVALHRKAIILLGLFFLLLVYLPTNSSLPVSVEIIGCILLGLVVAGIGFNIMHDAVHRSFSKNDTLNYILGYTLNMLGGDWRIWKQQHNADHHMHTNIAGHDGDIDLGKVARIHPNQKKRWIHKYQYIYLPLFLYPISYFAWIYFLDFQKAQRMRWKRIDYLTLIFSKCVHISLFVVFPLFFRSLSEVAIGYAIVLAVTGTVTSFVFQLAHVVEITKMVTATEKVTYDEIHQLITTANFATSNKFLSWYVGGLNFQREHHLYYKISHVHYPEINEEMKKVCDELHLPQNEYPTLISAIKSHIHYLKVMGKQ
ncbi:MAG: acyl-CoA desaturase [Candidatus Paceibacterota bacterium]